MSGSVVASAGFSTRLTGFSALVHPSSIANSISECSVPSALARDFGARPLRSSAAEKPRTPSRVIVDGRGPEVVDDVNAQPVGVGLDR